MKKILGLVLAACLVLLVTTIALRAYVGPYGFGVFLRHGGTYWFTVGTKSPQLSPTIRLPLRARSNGARSAKALTSATFRSWSMARLPTTSCWRASIRRGSASASAMRLRATRTSTNG